MSEKVTVSAITIQFPDGTTLDLSVEDARALYHQLDELFGRTPASAPIIIERDRWPRWNEVWCGEMQPMAPEEIRTDTPPPPTPQIWCSAAVGE